jgi:DNA-binding MarR family transcriptional regulator
VVEDRQRVGCKGRLTPRERMPDTLNLMPGTTLNDKSNFPPYEMLPTLVNRVAEKIVARANADYGGVGLNVRGARVMLALDGEKSLRVHEIVERCGIEPSTFSHLLGRLARLGYVTRSRPEHDNRAVVVALTPAGRRIVRTCIRTVKGHHDLLSNGLTEQEVKVLSRLLIKVFHSF